MKRTVRGFEKSTGPMALQDPKNYNQKLRGYLEDALDDAEEEPQIFP